MRCSGVLLLILLGFAPSVNAAPPTTDEAVDLVLDRVLGPIEEAASDQAERAIAIRELPGPVPVHNLADEIAGRFFDHGWDVYVLAPGDSVQPGALLLEYRVEEVAIRFPRRWRGFLGIRGQRTSRSLRLGLSAELKDADSGRWIWRGAPRARHEDWVSAAEAIGKDHRFFGASTDTANPIPPVGTGWYERGLVAGLLGGVLILYFSGVS
jgi:hypothetical protein